MHTATAHQIAGDAPTTFAAIAASPDLQKEWAGIGPSREVLDRCAAAIGEREFMPVAIRPGIRIEAAAPQAIEASRRSGMPVLVGHSNPEEVMLIDVGGRR